MSLLAQVVLVEKYKCMRLNMQQLAEELGMSKGTLMNQVSAGTLGIKTYMDVGKRWADIRDVAAHYDRLREAATA